VRGLISATSARQITYLMLRLLLLLARAVLCCVGVSNLQAWVLPECLQQ
jgi:hypothetical protein